MRRYAKFITEDKRFRFHRLDGQPYLEELTQHQIDEMLAPEMSQEQLDSLQKTITKHQKDFDEQNKRMLGDGFVLIDDEQHKLLLTGGYSIGEDGKLVNEPPYMPTLGELKEYKLEELARAAGKAYISGFVSTATGANVTFDSTEDDQRTLDIMYAASKSPDFADHPVYQGRIPLRGVPEGSTNKQIYYLDTAQMQKLMDDLALHIGTVKTKHWTLQSLVMAAQTEADLEHILMTAFTEVVNG